MNVLRALVVVACCVLPLSALAQWQWVDKDGRRVFSDKAPPPEIPTSSILKTPRGKAAIVDPAPVPAAAASAAASGPKVSGRDKALEDKKKQADAAEAEKKKAQDREMAQARSENCKRAKEGKATLDSGVRLSVFDEKGERTVLDDNQRAAEARRLDAVISRDCAAS